MFAVAPAFDAAAAVLIADNADAELDEANWLVKLLSLEGESVVVVDEELGAVGESWTSASVPSGRVTTTKQGERLELNLWFQKSFYLKLVLC